MSSIAGLPHDLREAVTREFQDETVLWTGRPSAFRAFLIASLIWLFAVPWTAFALFWESTVIFAMMSGKPPASGGWGMAGGVVFALFGLPFVVVGFSMLAVPFGVWAKARRTVHVISERRLTTLIAGRKLEVKSHALSSIVRTERVERPGGSGALKVVTGVRRDSDGDRVEESETLHGIADVRSVERLLAPYSRAQPAG